MDFLIRLILYFTTEDRVIIKSRQKTSSSAKSGFEYCFLIRIAGPFTIDVTILKAVKKFTSISETTEKKVYYFLKIWTVFKSLLENSKKYHQYSISKTFLIIANFYQFWGMFDLQKIHRTCFKVIYQIVNKRVELTVGSSREFTKI